MGRIWHSGKPKYVQMRSGSAAHIDEKVSPTFQPYRIRLRIPPQRRVVAAEVVVVEPGLLIVELPWEAVGPRLALDGGLAEGVHPDRGGDGALAVDDALGRRQMIRLRISPAVRGLDCDGIGRPEAIGCVDPHEAEGRGSGGRRVAGRAGEPELGGVAVIELGEIHGLGTGDSGVTGCARLEVLP